MIKITQKTSNIFVFSILLNTIFIISAENTTDITATFSTIDEIDYNTASYFDYTENTEYPEHGKRKNALIIAPESPITTALVHKLAQENYIIGIAAPTTAELTETLQELATDTYIKKLDLSKSVTTGIKSLNSFIDKMNGIDLCIILPDYSPRTPDDTLDFASDKKTVETEITALLAATTTTVHRFLCQDRGHILYVNSVDTLRSNTAYPTYNATKAFATRYLNNLRTKIKNTASPVTISEIKIGYLDHPDYEYHNSYWHCSPEKAAQQIMTTIKEKKNTAYINKRWRLIGALMHILPDWLYTGIGGLYTQLTKQ